LARQGAAELRARAKITSHFVIPDSGHLWLILIHEILERARYSCGFAQSDQPNLTQIRAPILLSYFCASPYLIFEYQKR
jgi:hypothetical protein